MLLQRAIVDLIENLLIQQNILQKKQLLTLGPGGPGGPETGTKLALLPSPIPPGGPGSPRSP